MLRPDFVELMEYAIHRGVGVKVSTNGALLDDRMADWIRGLPYFDVQVSIDGTAADTNDRIRGRGAFDLAVRAMDRLAARRCRFSVNSVVTRCNVDDLDGLYALAKRFGAELRLSRLRPSGRGLQAWADLRPDAAQNRVLHAWLVAHPEVATGDSFFHLSALGPTLSGMNICGAGRIICLIDPVGNVYPCPFLTTTEFLAGSVRDQGGFGAVWRQSPIFRRLRGIEPAEPCRSCLAACRCQSGCYAAKRFTGLALDGPDPDCVAGHGVTGPALCAMAATVPAARGVPSGAPRPVALASAVVNQGSM